MRNRDFETRKLARRIEAAIKTATPEQLRSVAAVLFPPKCPQHLPERSCGEQAKTSIKAGGQS
jgi:hypothetical protein